MCFNRHFKWIALIAILGAVNVDSIEEYSTEIDPMLNTEPPAEQPADTPNVTAVYGVDADDYLPVNQPSRQQARPQIRQSGLHPGFDLPDGFYFIGAPIFILILLRVLSMFLNEFEEKRREEQNVVASEHLPDERMLDD